MYFYNLFTGRVKDFASQMERIYQTDLANAAELTEQEWDARGIHRKFTELVLAQRMLPPTAGTSPGLVSPLASERI